MVWSGSKVLIAVAVLASIAAVPVFSILLPVTLILLLVNPIDDVLMDIK